MLTDTKPQIQEVWWISRKVNEKKFTSRHMIAKLWNIKEEGTMLRASEKKIRSSVNPLLVTPSISPSSTEARRQWPCIFRVLRKNYCQLRALYHPSGAKEKDFPGGPVVRTSPANAGGAGRFPGWGANIPRASQPKNRKHKSEAILWQIQ